MANALVAKLDQGDVWVKIVTAIKDLVGEVNFDCNLDAIQMQAMDTSHVALISLFLAKAEFQHWHLAGNRSQVFGVNLGSMGKVLACAGSGSSVTLSLLDRGDQLSFEFCDPITAETIKLGLKLIDIDADPLEIPPTNYTAIINMPSAVFEKKCSDMHKLGADTVSITPYRDHIKFTIACDMLSTGSFTIPTTPALDANDPACVRITLSDPAALEGPTQCFDLRYLNNFIKAKALSKSLVLNMSDELPLRLDFPFGEHGSYLRYFLAPKIAANEAGMQE